MLKPSQKARLIARATALKTYQIALAQAEVFDGSDNSAALNAADTNYTIDRADAELNYKIALADSDVVWINAVALADKTETHAWALANHGYDTGLAGLDRSYLVNQTQTDGDFETGLASSDSSLVTDNSAANNQFRSSRTTTEANYHAADHSARVNSFSNLHTSLDLPFTNFTVGQAIAEQTAWLNVQPDLQTTTANINTETSGYDNLVAGQITSLTGNRTGAEVTYVGTVAPAIQTKEVSDAGAWKLYDEQSSNAGEIYQQQVALANRNHTVAIAQAERNLTVNGDQTAYENALTAANTQHQADLLAAARTYAIAEIGAQGSRDLAFHNSTITLDTTEGNAHVTRTQTLTEAIRDAEIADAAGYAAMLLGIAEDLAAFIETEATALETELGNLAITALPQ